MKTKETPPLLPKRLSLIDQTVASLRHGIASGHWLDRLPSERELCDLLQVSRTTIRGALAEMQRSGWLGVSDRQRRRIKTQSQQPYGGAGKRVVALLFPSSLQSMHSRTMFVIDALRAYLGKLGYATESHVQTACFSAHPTRALEKLVRDHPAAVWIVFGSREPMQRWFTRRRLPVLIFGSCQPGIDIQSVDADHHAACHHAGGVLWRKGHRRIAFLIPQKAFGGELDSEQGLREVLQDLPGVQLHVLRHDGTAAHVCTLVDKSMRSPQPPTAYLVTHAEHALAVMTHLLRHGKRIPQDVALISRDSHAFLSSTSPPISHYGIDPALLARRVVAAARQLVSTRTLTAHPIRLMPKFVPGGTV
jgi:DNA-binding LacI/PurR family transcriptional regulator